MCRLGVAVITDRFNWATFHRLSRLGEFFGIDRLFEDVGVPFILGTGEIVWCGFATEIAIDTLAIDVELAGDVFHIFVFAIGHSK